MIVEPRPHLAVRVESPSADRGDFAVSLALKAGTARDILHPKALLSEVKTAFDLPGCRGVLGKLNFLTDAELAKLSVPDRAEMARRLCQPNPDELLFVDSDARNRAFTRVVTAGIPANAKPGQTAGAIDSVLCRIPDLNRTRGTVKHAFAEVVARRNSDAPIPGDWASFKRYLSQLGKGSPSNGKLYPGTHVELLVDGDETFGAELADIRDTKAGDIILGTRFGFMSDVRGEEYALALKEAAGRGVHIIYAYDKVGSSKTPNPVTHREEPTRWAMFDEIRAAGEVPGGVVPQLISLAPKFLAAEVNHRKAVLVVKRNPNGSVRESVGYVMGNNIGDHYDDWHDAGVRLRGPGVQGVGRELIHQLIYDNGATLAPELQALALQEHDKLPDANAEVCFTFHRGRRDELIKYSMLRAYQHTAHYADSLNPYDADETLLRAEIQAAERAQVRALHPVNNNQGTVQGAMRGGRFPRLKASGVQLLHYLGERPEGTKPGEWNGRMAHAKMSLYDRIVCTIGSSNRDWRSLFSNDEGNVWIFSKVVGKQMKASFDHDAALSRPDSEEPRRKLPGRVVDRVLWAFRKAL